ncbi:polysaccharide deacetylase family protein [Candidatus Omnitrophota bacterium]
MKIKKKHLIGAVFYYVGFLSLINYFRKKVLKKGSFTILTYHRISHSDYGDPFLSVTPYGFEIQIQYLTNKYRVVSLEELIQRIHSPNTAVDDYVAITFDDGYRDNYTNAYPILNKYNVPVTIFLTTGFIGTDKLFWWDRVTRIVKSIIRKNQHIDFSRDFYPEKIKDAIAGISSRDVSSSSKVISALLKEISEEKKNLILDDLEKQIPSLASDDQGRPYPLTWDEVRQMSEKGTEFGSHTVTHPILTRIESSQASNEILHSKVVLEGKIGKKVLHFAYPNGEKSDFDERIKQFVKDNNYISACTTINGANTMKDDVFSLKRRAIGNSPICVFASKIAGIFDLLNIT